MPTRSVIDNSAFAGVMRLYCPELEMHRRFLGRAVRWSARIHAVGHYASLWSFGLQFLGFRFVPPQQWTRRCRVVNLRNLMCGAEQV